MFKGGEYWVPFVFEPVRYVSFRPICGGVWSSKLFVIGSS